MTKILEFKLWKWFIPIFGLFYLIWFGWVTIIGKRVGGRSVDIAFGDIDNAVIAVLAQLYVVVHVYSFAIFLSWILSIFGVI